MEHEEAPAALAAVGASSSLDLFDFESEVNGSNYVGGQSIGGRMFADGRFLPPNDSRQAQFAIWTGGEQNTFSSMICPGSISVSFSAVFSSTP